MICFPALNPNIFWTAPEILRTSSQWKPTQPGDVYSFAIILYEMCTRSEPYTQEIWFKSVEGKLFRLRCIGTPPCFTKVSQREANFVTLCLPLRTKEPGKNKSTLEGINLLLR